MSTATAPRIEQLNRNRFARLPELDASALTEDSLSVPSEDNLSVPSNEDIARLAYSYWEERVRNQIVGSAAEDWYRAERELRS